MTAYTRAEVEAEAWFGGQKERVLETVAALEAAQAQAYRSSCSWYFANNKPCPCQVATKLQGELAEARDWLSQERVVIEQLRARAVSAESRVTELEANFAADDEYIGALQDDLVAERVAHLATSRERDALKGALETIRLGKPNHE